MEIEIEKKSSKKKSKRRKYIKKYYKIINAYTKHRAKLKSNTLANCVKSFNIKQLAS